MEYEAPELTALTPAISAIQGRTSGKEPNDTEDANLVQTMPISSYEEWE
jgi:hypothetical protein